MPSHAGRRAPAGVFAVMPVPDGAPFWNQPLEKSPVTGDEVVVSDMREYAHLNEVRLR